MWRQFTVSAGDIEDCVVTVELAETPIRGPQQTRLLGWKVYARERMAFNAARHSFCKNASS
jgi:hypothetical protein